jgi:uncharacterized membrane protein (GlpM family)
VKRGGSLSFFDDFHFSRSRVIGLDMTENRIFTLCRMITWVVFLRIFWNFISSLRVKRGVSLSFLTIFTFAVPKLLDLIMTENRIFTLCRMITWVVFLRIFWNFISSLPVKRGGSLSFLTIFTFVVPELLDLIMTENRIFTLCRMITWVVFLRMFWNFISSLPVKRGGSLSFLVGTISNVLVMEIGWTDVGSGGIS